MSNFYEILGVPRSASPGEIKKAYRRLARQYHPDLNRETNAEERFREITAAYEILSNEDKRTKYDRLSEGTHAASASIDDIFEGTPYAKFARQIFERDLFSEGGSRGETSHSVGHRQPSVETTGVSATQTFREAEQRRDTTSPFSKPIGQETLRPNTPKMRPMNPGSEKKG